MKQSVPGDEFEQMGIVGGEPLPPVRPVDEFEALGLTGGARVYDDTPEGRFDKMRDEEPGQLETLAKRLDMKLESPEFLQRTTRPLDFPTYATLAQRAATGNKFETDEINPDGSVDSLGPEALVSLPFAVARNLIRGKGLGLGAAVVQLGHAGGLLRRREDATLTRLAAGQEIQVGDTREPTAVLAQGMAGQPVPRVYKKIEDMTLEEQNASIPKELRQMVDQFTSGMVGPNGEDFARPYDRAQVIYDLAKTGGMLRERERAAASEELKIREALTSKGDGFWNSLGVLSAKGLPTVGYGNMFLVGKTGGAALASGMDKETELLSADIDPDTGEVLREGADYTDALLRGYAYGAFEASIERYTGYVLGGMFRGADKFLGGHIAKILSKGADKAAAALGSKAIGRAVVELAKGVRRVAGQSAVNNYGIEYIEEGVQQWGDTVFARRPSENTAPTYVKNVLNEGTGQVEQVPVEPGSEEEAEAARQISKYGEKAAYSQAGTRKLTVGEKSAVFLKDFGTWENTVALAEGFFLQSVLTLGGGAVQAYQTKEGRATIDRALLATGGLTSADLLRMSDEQKAQAFEAYYGDDARQGKFAEVFKDAGEMLKAAAQRVEDARAWRTAAGSLKPSFKTDLKKAFALKDEGGTGQTEVADEATGFQVTQDVQPEGVTYEVTDPSGELKPQVFATVEAAQEGAERMSVLKLGRQADMNARAEIATRVAQAFAPGQKVVLVQRGADLRQAVEDEYAAEGGTPPATVADSAGLVTPGGTIVLDVSAITGVPHLIRLLRHEGTHGAISRSGLAGLMKGRSLDDIAGEFQGAGILPPGDTARRDFIERATVLRARYKARGIELNDAQAAEEVLAFANEGATPVIRQSFADRVADLYQKIRGGAADKAKTFAEARRAAARVLHSAAPADVHHYGGAKAWAAPQATFKGDPLATEKSAPAEAAGVTAAPVGEATKAEPPAEAKAEPKGEPKSDAEAATGKEFKSEDFDALPKIGEGSESAVYDEGTHVLKVGEPYNAKETLAARVRDTLRGDRLAGDGSLEYVGYYKGKNGVLNPVFRQRKIEGRSATKEEVRAHMVSRGWTAQADGTYTIPTSEGEVSTLGDLDTSDNVIISKDGTVQVRDIATYVKPAAPKSEVTPEAAAPAAEVENHRAVFEDETTFEKFQTPKKLTSYKQQKGFGVAQYADPKTGSVDVYIAAFGDNDFVAYMRKYKDGKPTNRFVSKLERRTDKPGVTREMVRALQEVLPEGHEYTEDTSVSTDGLRFMAGQLKHGYELARGADGKVVTSKVAVSGESLTNDLPLDIKPSGKFEDIRIADKAQFEKVRPVLAKILAQFGAGLTEDNVRLDGDVLTLDVPVLRKMGAQSAIAPDVNAPSGPSVQQADINKKPPAISPAATTSEVVPPAPEQAEKPAAVTPPKGDLKMDGGTPADIEGDKAAVEAQQKKRQGREEIKNKAAAPIKGTAGDMTGSLIPGTSDVPLFTEQPAAPVEERMKFASLRAFLDWGRKNPERFRALKREDVEIEGPAATPPKPAPAQAERPAEGETPAAPAEPSDFKFRPIGLTEPRRVYEAAKAAARKAWESNRSATAGRAGAPDGRTLGAKLAGALTPEQAEQARAEANRSAATSSDEANAGRVQEPGEPGREIRYRIDVDIDAGRVPLVTDMEIPEDFREDFEAEWKEMFAGAVRNPTELARHILEMPDEAALGYISTADAIAEYLQKLPGSGFSKHAEHASMGITFREVLTERRNAPKPSERDLEEGKLQVRYFNRSGVEDVSSMMVSRDLALAMAKASDAFLDRHPEGVVAYVTGKMGWTAEQLRSRLDGSQIDTLASALERVDDGTGFVVGSQCVAGETRIYDPCTGEHRTIRELCEKGEPITVLSLTPDGLVPTPAGIPFRKGVDDLYRVTMDDGRSITVTREHRFLTPVGWQALGDGLDVGHFLASAEGHPACSLGFAPSTRPEGGQRSPDTAQDCQASCLHGHCSCGEQPRSEADSAPASAPLPACAPERILGDCGEDDSGLSQECTPAGRSHDPRARSSSSPSENRAPSQTCIPTSGRVQQESKPTPQSVWPSRHSSVSPHQESAETQADQSAGGASHSTLPVSDVSHPTPEEPVVQNTDSFPSPAPHREDACPRDTAQQHAASVQVKASLFGFPLEYHTGWRRVVAIEFVRTDEFFDMVVPGAANYTAEGFINHNTGAGKGRVLAAIMAYHIKSDRVAVFFTDRAKLLTDIWRDIVDIGEEATFRPLVINRYVAPESAEGGADSPDVFSMPLRFERPETDTAIRTHTLPKSATAVFLTYSQLQQLGTESAQNKIALLSKLLSSGNGALVLDEAHLAAGPTSQRGGVLRMLAGLPSAGVVFSSATFAKRGENMGLYKRAGYSRFFESDEEMEEVLQKGGVPYQQFLAAKLTEGGYYTRHELDYENVAFKKTETTDTLDTPQARTELAAREETTADAFNGAVRGVLEFLGEVRRVNMELPPRVPKIVMRGQNIASSLHNVAAFIYTALKAETVGNAAVAELRAGRAPVITLYNTNQALLDVIGEGNVAEPGAYLRRLAERAISIRIGDDEYASILTLPGYDALVKSAKVRNATELRRQAEDLMRAVVAVSEQLAAAGVSASPIDKIRETVEAAGFKFAELTGRTKMVRNGVVTPRVRPKSADTVVNDFNSSLTSDGKPNTVLVINSSAASGLSLHASPRFRNRADRVMFVLQPAWDINEMMQLFGRVNRKNQLSKPVYKLVFTTAAGEQRNAAILMKKLRSLSANTSGVSKAGYGEDADDALDFMNAFGEKAWEEMRGERHPVAVRLERLSNSGDFNGATVKLMFLPTREQGVFMDDLQARVASLQEHARESGAHDLEARDVGTVPLTTAQLSTDGGMRAYETAITGSATIHTAGEALALAEASRDGSEKAVQGALEKLAELEAKAKAPSAQANFDRADSTLRRALNALGNVYRQASQTGEHVWFIPIGLWLPPSGRAHVPSDWRIKVAFNSIRGTPTMALSTFDSRVLDNASRAREQHYNDNLTRREVRTLIAGDITEAITGSIVAAQAGAVGLPQIVKATPADDNFPSFVLMMPRNVTVSNAKRIVSSRRVAVTDIRDLQMRPGASWASVDNDRIRIRPGLKNGVPVSASFEFNEAMPRGAKSQDVPVRAIIEAAGLPLSNETAPKGFVSTLAVGAERANTALAKIAALHPALQPLRVVSDEGKVSGEPPRYRFFRIDTEGDRIERMDDSELRYFLISSVGYEAKDVEGRTRRQLLKMALSADELDAPAAPSGRDAGDVFSRRTRGGDQPRYRLEGADLNAAPGPVFFSQLRRTLEAKMPNRMTVMALRGMIDPAKGSGVKADEIEWSGLKEFLDSKNPGDYVTKAEVLEATKDTEIQEVVKGGEYASGLSADEEARMNILLNLGSGNRTSEEEFELANLREQVQTGLANHDTVRTKFSQYQLPGGENYRELLLTLPAKEQPLTRKAFQLWRNGSVIAQGDAVSAERWKAQGETDIREATVLAQKKTQPKHLFLSSHFSEPNILVHVRFNERMSYPAGVGAGSVQAKGNEAGANSLAANAKRLTDLVETDAFRTQGLSGLNVEQREAVKAGMIGAIGDEQVRRRVIENIPVDVMNDLRRLQLSPEQFLNDKAMLSDSLSLRLDAPVLLSPAAASSLVRAATRLAAERVGASLKLTGKSVNGNSAGETGGFHGPYRTLFLEEVQSDFHQTGREKGYGVPGGVPNAPFKDTSKGWARLAFKRMLRWAAENGFDRVAWTTGEQQAERYSLSKQVDTISATKFDDGTYSVLAEKGGRSVITEKAADKKALTGLVGKELANKIDAQDVDIEGSKTYSGLDLKVGGEGMRTFYDQILPTIANDIGKKFGARTEDVGVETEPASFSLYVKSAEQYLQREFTRAEVENAIAEQPDAYKVIEHPAKSVTVHSLPVTPAMRDSVMQGQPRYRLDVEDIGAPVRVGTATRQGRLEDAAGAVGKDFPILEYMRGGSKLVIPYKQTEGGEYDWFREMGGYKAFNLTEQLAFFRRPATFDGGGNIDTLAQELKFDNTEEFARAFLDEVERSREMYRIEKERLAGRRAALGEAARLFPGVSQTTLGDLMGASIPAAMAGLPEDARGDLERLREAEGDGAVRHEMLTRRDLFQSVLFEMWATLPRAAGPAEAPAEIQDTSTFARQEVAAGGEVRETLQNTKDRIAVLAATLSMAPIPGVPKLTDAAAVADVQAAIDAAGPEAAERHAQDLIAQRLSGARTSPLTKGESTLMLWYLTRLDARQADSDRRVKEAFDDGDLLLLSTEERVRQRVTQDAREFLTAMRQYGSAAGQALQALKLRVDRSFDIVSMYNQAVKDNGNVALTPEQYAALRNRIARLEQSFADYVDAATTPTEDADVAKRIADLEAKIAALTESAPAQEGAIGTDTARLAQLRSELAALSEESSMRAERRAVLRGQIDAVSREIEMRRATLQDNTDLEARLASLVAQHAVLDAESGGASQARLDALNDEIAALEADLTQRRAAHERALVELATAKARLERVRALKAKLDRATGGAVQRARLRREAAAHLYGDFKAEVEKAQVERMAARWRGASPLGRFWLGLSVLQNAVRALQASGDESVAGRQLGKLGLAHPILWARALRDTQGIMALSWKTPVDESGRPMSWQERSDRALFEADSLLREHPLWAVYRAAGGDWIDLIADPKSIDEMQIPVSAMMRAYIPRRLGGTAMADLIDVSNNHYAGMSNMLRFSVFTQMYADLVRLNNGEAPAKEDLRAAASTVDIFGGRGDLSDSRVRAAVTFSNSFLYSARLAVSNVQFVTRAAGLVGNPAYSLNARRVMAMEYLRTAGGYAAMTGLFWLLSRLFSKDPDKQRFQLEPAHPAFLQFMVGQSRVDLTGGFATWARYLLALTGGPDRMSTESGLNTGDRAPLDGETFLRLLRSKLAPLPGFLFDTLKGQTYDGMAAGPLAEERRQGYGRRYLNMFESLNPAPLSAQSLVELVRGNEESGIHPVTSPLLVTMAAVFEMIGVLAAPVPVSPRLSQEVARGYERNAKELESLKRKQKEVLNSSKLTPWQKERQSKLLQRKIDRIRQR